MTKAVCPGCGESVSLEGLKAGDHIECPNCANLSLRLKEDHGKYFLTEIPKVSCPSCDRSLDVPEELGAGDTLMCCDTKYVLTYEFGAYALVSLE